jgi:hypothetical protein
MNHIDEFMLDLLNSQNKSVLDILREKNCELKKAAFKNYHKVLLGKWLMGLAFVAVGAVIGLVISNLIPASAIYSNASTLDNLTKTIVAPSLTMNGLFVTFIPVIGFFFLSEIKEMEKEAREDSDRLAKNVGKQEEAKIEIEKRVKYEHAFFYNFKTGILNYIRSYVTIALASLLFLLFAYALFSSALFLIADILALVVLLVGIYPIISVALNKPALTLVTIFLKDGEQEMMLYGD